MKFKLISFFIIFTAIQQMWAEPLLVVVLMVKNEANVIEATLQPYVDGGVTDFLIFDTGSTDRTQEIAADFFKRHDITNAYIVEEPFINYAPSRNRALELAQDIFPQATFMLMPDAEWYMHNVEGLLQFCTDHKDTADDYYWVPIRSTRLAFYTARLIRCHTGVQFVGTRHETLNKITQAKLPYEIYFEWRPSEEGNERSAARWARDRDSFLEDYAQNPYDPRTVFYLAQSYHCLGDWENAYMYYQKRAEINGWNEENFITHLRLGDVALQLENNNISPENHPAIHHYLAAHTLRPHRAEPFIKIAQYYLDKGDMHQAFLFALRTAHMPYPEHDILFVEKYLYDFARYDILGISAWYVGEYKRGEWAILKALQAYPNEVHLWRNLQLYYDRKKDIQSAATTSFES